MNFAFSDPGRLPAEMIYVHTAANRIGVSKRTIRRFIHEGKLRAERSGQRAWAVYRCDVDHLRIERGESC
jgi:excisionase family DNA binding protein